MAVNAPFGFRPVRYLNGTPYNGAVTLYPKANVTEIAKGDPVMALGSGEVGRASASTNAILGYCMGTETTGANGTITFSNMLASADSGRVHVAHAHELVCEVQMADAHVATAADIFAAAETTSATPSTAYGISQYEISSVIGVGAGQFKIVGISDNPDNDATATFRNILVVANEPFFGATGIDGV